MLALVDDARAEGLDVTFDTYPYEWASTRLLIMIPPWVQAGGPEPHEGAAGGLPRSASASAGSWRSAASSSPGGGPGRRPARGVPTPDLLRWEGRRSAR